MNEISNQGQSEKNMNEDFTFSNLGVWRKIYLALNWVSLLGISLLFLKSFISVALESGLTFQGTLISAVLILIFPFYCYWLHISVSKRKLDQLTVLTIVQIIPSVNPVSALILFAIRSTSKTEREASQT